jgi:hypothetical protein
MLLPRLPSHLPLMKLQPPGGKCAISTKHEARFRPRLLESKATTRHNSTSSNSRRNGSSSSTIWATTVVTTSLHLIAFSMALAMLLRHRCRRQPSAANTRRKKQRGTKAAAIGPSYMLDEYLPSGTSRISAASLLVLGFSLIACGNSSG